MSEINIMDFDPSSSIKSYNFTNTAIRRFYDTIDSEQFKDEKKEKIFESYEFTFFKLCRF